MTGRARGGVTLMEMVVVLAIMAIAAAVVVPALPAPTRVGRDDGLGAARAAVAGLLARARATARERGRTVTLTIDPATARWWVRAGEAPDTAGTLDLPAGAALGAAGGDVARAHVVFTAAGPAHGDTIVVRFGGRETSLSVDPWTGAVAP